jgi:hypothetical protein
MSGILVVSMVSGGIVSWTVPEDIVITGMQLVLGNGVISADPDLTWSTWQSPSVDSAEVDFKLQFDSSSYLGEKLEIPISKGTKLYFAPNATGNMGLLFFSLTAESMTRVRV